MPQIDADRQENSVDADQTAPDWFESTLTVCPDLSKYPGSVLFLPVDVRLHEPLLARGITLGDVRVEMMSLCSQLELLCRKELYEVP